MSFGLRHKRGDTRKDARMLIPRDLRQVVMKKKKADSHKEALWISASMVFAWRSGRIIHDSWLETLFPSRTLHALETEFNRQGQQEQAVYEADFVDLTVPWIWKSLAQLWLGLEVLELLETAGARAWAQWGNQRAGWWQPKLVEHSEPYSSFRYTSRYF